MKRRPTITFPIIQHSINNHFKNNGSMPHSTTSFATTAATTPATMAATTTTTTSMGGGASCWQWAGHSSGCANHEHHLHYQQHHCYGGRYKCSSPAPTTGDRNDLKTYLVVSFVAIVCYVNGLQGDFVHDDIPAITMNKDVIGINPVTNVFRNDFWGTPMSDVNSHKSYRPLTTLSFRLNYLMFGLRPLWFHTTNILLHAAACILFTRVCSKIAGFRWNFTILAGVLFAVHPIHTEAVTGIVGRADVLACIFFLLSVLIYHGNTNDPNNTAVWISIVLGGLSMLAKETGITVFLINIGYDIYRSWPAIKRTITDLRWSDEARQVGRRVTGLLLAMGVLLAVRLALLQGSLPRFSQQDNPTAFHPSFYVRLLTFCYLAAFNWWLVLCPSTLSHDWQMGSIPLLTSISDTRNIITFVAFCAALLIAYKCIIDFEHQRHVPLVLGFLFLTLPFLPATNLVVTVGFVVAERVLYIPSVGSVILVVYAVQLLWDQRRRWRKWMLVCLAILVMAGGCKTVLRNEDWQSRESLLRAGLQVLPHNAKLHYNFGNFMRDTSHSDHAINHYKEALRLWPGYASAHNNLGTLMHPQSVAEHHFLEAIRYSNEHLNAHYNLGQLYRKSNRSTEAVRMLQRCIKIEPDFTAAYLELVKIYGGNEAGKLLRRIVSINSRNADLRLQYANWLFKKNLLYDALHQYQRGLSIGRLNQMCMIGASHTLRKLGQHSRLHQMILRWQLNSRLANGGGKPIQKDIYLRDWSIKNELRNRALIYDNGAYETTDYVSHKSTSAEPKPSPTPNINYFDTALHEPDDIHYRVLKSVHCNRSDHTEASLKVCKRLSASAPSTSTTANPGNSDATKPVDCKSTRCKAWSKKRHKAKDTPNIEPNDSITPFIVSNMLDKL